MRTITTILAVLVILCVAAIAVPAQDFGKAPQPKKGPILGVGLGHWTYTTYWYYYSSSGFSSSHYPVHIHRRTQMSVYLEMQPIIRTEAMEFTLRGEGQFSFMGGTTEDWLTEGETISGGGGVAGGGVWAKASIPIKMSNGNVFRPFAGFGAQYLYIGSDGEDVPTSLITSGSYNYPEGWSEWLWIYTPVIGAELQTSKYRFAVDFRFDAGGSSSTDWTPAGVGVDGDGLKMFAINGTVGVTL